MYDYTGKTIFLDIDVHKSTYSLRQFAVTSHKERNKVFEKLCTYARTAPNHSSKFSRAFKEFLQE